ncbi:MAG: flavodoxin family protein [Deltaproteobacteria bacterium]|jgi:multimeric flavodoxin WrbA|nr:flavodoxin family protein [Deltaproteobacteria bacterium]
MTQSIDILGLHLSPRRGGTSRVVLDYFLKGAKNAGASTEVVSVSEFEPIQGCLECGACNHKGECAVEDDMSKVYRAFEATKKIVVSTSLFFYDVPAQGKALIDRSQAFWARRYVLGQHKNGRPGAKGFLIAVGATKGKDLFLPVTLSVRYFFDSLAYPKDFGTLFFRKLESPSDLTAEQLQEVEAAGEAFVSG